MTELSRDEKKIFEFGIGWIQKMSYFQIHQFRNIPNILKKKYWEFVDLKNDIIWIHQIPNLKTSKIFLSSPLIWVTNYGVAWMGLNFIQAKRETTFWPLPNNLHPSVIFECNWCLFQITRFPIKVISNQPTFCMTERRRYLNWLILALLKELVKPLKIRSPNQDTLNVNESWPLVIWRILWNHHHHVVLVIRNEE